MIGEAPPPNGTTFFYVPKLPSSRKIEAERTMSATIFHHYFGELPRSLEQYEGYLLQLKYHGIYLIDILDEPIRIRGHSANEAYLVSKIPAFKQSCRRRRYFTGKQMDFPAGTNHLQKTHQTTLSIG